MYGDVSYVCVLSKALALYHHSDVPPTFLGYLWIYGIEYTCTQYIFNSPFWKISLLCKSLVGLEDPKLVFLQLACPAVQEH